MKYYKVANLIVFFKAVIEKSKIRECKRILNAELVLLYDFYGDGYISSLKIMEWLEGFQYVSPTFTSLVTDFIDSQIDLEDNISLDAFMKQIRPCSKVSYTL